MSSPAPRSRNRTVDLDAVVLPRAEVGDARLGIDHMHPKPLIHARARLVCREVLARDRSFDREARTAFALWAPFTRFAFLPLAVSGPGLVGSCEPMQTQDRQQAKTLAAWQAAPETSGDNFELRWIQGQRPFRVRIADSAPPATTERHG